MNCMICNAPLTASEYCPQMRVQGDSPEKSLGSVKSLL